MPITSFRGQHAFLSNFYTAPIERRGILYPTAEHAYQAAKTGSRKMKRRIAASPSPKLAKHLGYKVELRDDWEEVKFRIMLNIVRMKFKQNPNLIPRLLATWPEGLIHDNTHGDTLWGTVNQIGRNHLGIILMILRKEFMSV